MSTTDGSSDSGANEVDQLAGSSSLADAVQRLEKVMDYIGDPSLILRKEVRDLYTDVQLMNLFLTGVRYELRRDFLADLLCNESFVDALEQINDAAERIAFALFTLNSEGYTDSVDAAATEASSKLREGQLAARSVLIRTIPQSLDPVWRRKAIRVADTGADHFQARSAVAESLRNSEKTLRNTEETQKLLEVAQQAVGKTGQVTLGDFFDDYAKREYRAANWLRGLSSFLLLLLTGGLYVLVFTNRLLPDTASELLRLSLALPLVALAGYFARESTKHRRNSTWARRFAIKLRTLPAFAESNGGVHADDFWKAMGVGLFGSTDSELDVPTNPSDHDGLYEDLIRGVEKVSDTVSRIRSGAPSDNPTSKHAK